MRTVVSMVGVVSASMAAHLACAQAPTTIYVNGNVYTMDAARPRASAIAVVGDRVLAVGSDAEIRAIGAQGEGTAVVDLEGRTVLPGLIDCHGHVAGLGAFGIGLMDLSRAQSFTDVVAAVSRRVSGTAPGDWITGGRWDHESWPSRVLPSHGELSGTSPQNPVWLRRVDGHAGLANAKAMELAGVKADTPSPPGGEIIHDAAGNPTGVFVDTAMSLITRVVPATAAGGTTEELILKAQEMCLASGLTGVHDAGIPPQQIEVYQSLVDSGRLKMRVYAMVSGGAAMKWFDENELIIGERFTCRAAKLVIDGAMGSRGAWMLEPYADRPTTNDGKPYTGLAVTQPDFIEAVAKHALQKGYQVCTHAIGDRGNREVLDAYERAGVKTARRHLPPPRIGRSPEKADIVYMTPVPPRFRVEHAQLLSPADIARFAALGVIPSMQPTHCTSDMRWVDARVGPERAKGAYVWASLLKTGVRIAGGSDFPVESHDPFLGLYAAITRQNEQGEPAGGWMPHERMTREEALRSFTIDAAYAAFEEDLKGSLAPGKYADFIVIDRDVMTCEPKEILGTKVLRTVIAGETVYEADPGG